MKNYFFQKYQVSYLFDNDDNENENDNNDVNDNDNDINKDKKEEEEDDDEKIFFSKVSSVISFRNHKFGLI